MEPVAVGIRSYYFQKRHDSLTDTAAQARLGWTAAGGSPWRIASFLIGRGVLGTSDRQIIRGPAAAAVDSITVTCTWIRSLGVKVLIMAMRL